MEYLSTGQVCEGLGRSRTVVMKYVRQGRLVAVRHERLGWVFDREVFEEFKEGEFKKIDTKGGKPKGLHLRSGASRKSTSVSEVNNA